MLPQRQVQPQQLHPLHPLELVLLSDIANHYNERAFGLISLFLNPPAGELSPPSLECITQRGSFLYQSIVVGNLPVFWRLFAIQKNNPEIIFRRNPASESTVFHGAAKSDNFSVIDDLVNAATTISKIDVLYKDDFKYWLHMDYAEMTPLMWAVNSSAYETAKKLIFYIAQEDADSAVLHIKQVNRRGENPMHFVFYDVASEGVLDVPLARKEEDLVEFGAQFFNLLVSAGMDLVDFNYCNINFRSPFNCFRELTLNCQIAMFKQLDEPAKLIVLDSYHQYLASLYPRSFDSVGKCAYFTLAGLFSLKKYMVAKLEFDLTLPSPEFCTLLVTLPDGRVRHINENVPLLSGEVFELIPLHSARLFAGACESAAGKKNKRRLKKIEKRQQVAAQRDAELLLGDIAEIEKIMLDIHRMTSKHKKSYEMIFLTSAAIEVCIGLGVYSAIDQANFDGLVISLHLLVMFTLALLVVATFAIDDESNVAFSHTAWDSTVSKIEHGVFRHLLLVTGEGWEQKSSVIESLRHDLRQLKNDQTKASAIGFFKHAKSTLTELREIVVSTNKPFSRSG